MVVDEHKKGDLKPFLQSIHCCDAYLCSPKIKKTTALYILPTLTLRTSIDHKFRKIIVNQNDSQLQVKNSVDFKYLKA